MNGAGRSPQPDGVPVAQAAQEGEHARTAGGPGHVGAGECVVGKHRVAGGAAAARKDEGGDVLGRGPVRGVVRRERCVDEQITDAGQAAALGHQTHPGSDAVTGPGAAQAEGEEGRVLFAGTHLDQEGRDARKSPAPRAVATARFGAAGQCQQLREAAREGIEAGQCGGAYRRVGGDPLIRVEEVNDARGAVGEAEFVGRVRRRCRPRELGGRVGRTGEERGRMVCRESPVPGGVGDASIGLGLCCQDQVARAGPGGPADLVTAPVGRQRDRRRGTGRNACVS